MLRLWAVLWTGAAALAGSLGCSSVAQNAGPEAGAAGISGSTSVGGGGADHGHSAGSVGSTGGAGSASSACLEHPPARHAQGSVLSLPLQLVMAGKPFVFGQPNLLADGGSLVPLNLRFYISEVELLPADGEQPVAVDIVTEQGDPAPYGVYLFNAEDEQASALRVLAPPGQYSGLSFALGIKLSCNQQMPASLSEPLTDTSQMTWPHAGGFLFLRYEGRYMADGSGGAATADSSAEYPPAVHMGGNISKELVPRVIVAGALSVSAGGTLEKSLSVAMDEIFKGATSDLDISDVSVGLLSAPSAQAGERLRRELPGLQAFVLDP